MKDVQFEQTRKALQSKQRDLKRKGKGNKPNASVLGKFHGRSAFKHGVVQQHNPFWVTRL